MTVMDPALELRPKRPGYRLHRLEIFNWGTFDSETGTVYRFEPEGRTSLLVGHNGSGKSTLVDAILTLLVPATIRNYNVAAGAKKTERSEKSYIRGAYGRSSDETQTTIVKYLRPKGNNLTAISAVFRDEQLEQAFTVSQVLHLTADGSPDKVFAFADEDRALRNDLNNLQSSDNIRDHLRQLGYKTTKKFIEYHGWIAKRTGMRGKAMDMLNQTVAVKDIRSLNDFIRRHMLEVHDWRDKVQRLLAHFTDLSVAHQELVRARRAQELLTPVEKIGGQYRTQAAELQAVQNHLSAATTFGHQEVVQLYTPHIAGHEEELALSLAARQRLGDELALMAERIRGLKNEIENAGGQRLRELPLLINNEQTVLRAKSDVYRRYHGHLRRCGIEQAVASADDFAAMRQTIQELVESVSTAVDEITHSQEELLAERGDLRRQLRQEETELRILEQRQTNLPARLATLRQRLCEDLQLSEAALPFAAELIAVSADEMRWEASAEMVLRSFALSLLVPDRYYRRVRAYVENNALQDARGQGQRLVYLRITQAPPADESGDRLHPQSLLRKLQFREGHDLTPWVRGEVQRRFDFRCCDSIEEFNDTTHLAMTANRHIRLGTDRHEKDDRPRTTDPRYYVLGWDNREKKRRIAAHIQHLQSAIADLDQRLATQTQQLETLRSQREAALGVMEVAEFDAIDVKRHQDEIAALEHEKRELETSNEAVQALRTRLAQLEATQEALQNQRDDALRRETKLESELASARQLIANAQHQLDQAQADGSYAGHTEFFPAIRAAMQSIAAELAGVADASSVPLTCDNFFICQERWKHRALQRVETLRTALQPLSEKLLEAMGRFLREFKEEQADLTASLQALDSFLGLLDQVRREDLPRHEKKFKDRLNDKVSQEVALFHGALRQECRHIEDKIGQLNEALAQLEYHPGTFMRLEPREVVDREIADFRRALRECLDDSLENTPEANEARFLRIQSLVERLGDKNNTRWRDKVIDVRRWYDFAAREVTKEDGATRSYYEDSSGQSGGEKAKLAFTILVAAIAYQYDLDPSGRTAGRFQFVVVDEMFSKVDDQNAEYALRLFEQFGLQLLIVAPLDAKARVTEPFVDCYLHVVKNADTNRSEMYSMTAREYEEVALAHASPP